MKVKFNGNWGKNSNVSKSFTALMFDITLQNVLKSDNEKNKKVN
jgi:hypothetical protein